MTNDLKILGLVILLCVFVKIDTFIIDPFSDVATIYDIAIFVMIVVLEILPVCYFLFLKKKETNTDTNDVPERQEGIIENTVKPVLEETDEMINHAKPKIKGIGANICRKTNTLVERTKSRVKKISTIMRSKSRQALGDFSKIFRSGTSKKNF